MATPLPADPVLPGATWRPLAPGDPEAPVNPRFVRLRRGLAE